MEVTYVEEFGKLRYVHMIIDKYLGFLMAVAQIGEATKHVITHCLKFCSSYLWIPKTIEMDNVFKYVIILKDKEL